MHCLARALISVPLLGALAPSFAVAEGSAVHPDTPVRPDIVAGEVYGAWSPTPEHRDARHGHDHVYPDRGAVFRDAPRGAIVVNYAGLAYRFYDGVWFEPRGPAFMVVIPPIGLVVPSLPPFTTRVVTRGQTYLYANDTYYLERPDHSGYEVVNAPADAAASVTTASRAPLTGAAPDPDADAVVHPLAPAGAAPLAVAATPPLTTSPAPAVAAPPSTAPVPQPTAFAPPPTVSTTSYVPPVPFRVPGTSLTTSPRNGQSPDQQARDRYECYRFAVIQTGFDPLRAGGAGGDRRSDYQRAQTACFEALGYTVR